MYALTEVLIYKLTCTHTAGLERSGTTTLIAQKPSPMVSHRELASVASHVSRESSWKQLAQSMNINPAQKKSIKRVLPSHNTSSERHFESVVSLASPSDLVLEEKGTSTTETSVRKKVVQQLLSLGHTSLATDLETGMIERRASTADIFSDH